MKNKVDLLERNEQQLSLIDLFLNNSSKFKELSKKGQEIIDEASQLTNDELLNRDTYVKAFQEVIVQCTAHLESMNEYAKKIESEPFDRLSAKAYKKYLDKALNDLQVFNENYKALEKYYNKICDNYAHMKATSEQENN